MENEVEKFISRKTNNIVFICFSISGEFSGRHNLKFSMRQQK